MATEEAGRTVAYASEQVDELLRCPICLDRYNEPRILPCQHTFCVSPCLQGLVDMMSRSVRCPECRMQHYVPAQGAQGFPTNRIVANFLDLQAQTMDLPSVRGTQQEDESTTPEAEPEPDVPGKCGVCEKDAETSRCVHCNKLACEACRKTHFNQMKFDTGRLVSQIRRGLPKISNAIAGVEQKSEQVKQHVESVKSEVRDTMERYIKELRDREKMLCSELDTFLQGEQRNLRLHQENLEVDMASISSYCESTESRVNRAECDLTEEDLVNMKHQCSEYMTQLGTVEEDAVPDTRAVTFAFSGNALHGSIVGFGEVSIGNMTARRNSVPELPMSTSPTTAEPDTRVATSLTLRRASVPAPNGNSPPQTNNRLPPAGPSRFNDQRSRGQVPTYTSTLNAPFTNVSSSDQSLSRARSPLLRSASDFGGGGNDMGLYSDYMTSPRTMAALRGGYMFQMDTDTRRILQEMDLPWQQDPTPRGRQNVGSMFGRDTFNREDRPAGFMGGGGGGGAPATTAAPRVVDSRPAISFSVGVGDNGSMRARGRPPRRVRARGTDRGRGGANTNGNASQNSSQTTEAEAPARGAAPSRAVARGRGASRGQRRENQDRSGGRTFRASNGSQGESNNERSGENSSSSEPQAGPSGEHPRIQARRGTYVMEDEEEEEDELARPNVGEHHDDDDDVVMGNSNVSNANLVHNETQVNTRAVNNYQKKGVMKKKLGGERGNATGQFSWPRGVTVSPSNDSIVVADSSNHRVQIFDCNGVYVTTFGSYGNGPGEFDCLAGVAMNSTGQIIIADRYNHRVQIFDRYGTFLKQFGQEGSGQGQLSYPWGVAVDYLGNIYVCDKENHRLQVFKPDGSFLRKIGRLGNRKGQMENPHYVAVGQDGRILVSDTSNHRIQVFNSEGRHLLNIGTEGPGQGQLKLPKGIAVDQQGFVIVADSGNSRVQVFRANGSYYSNFGGHGAGPGQFKGLEGLALSSDGKIIVSDKENHRIQIF